MCGICGAYGGEGAAANELTARGMCSLIVHRGPDGEGFYSRGSLGMGMRRLAIIDLKTGDQPVYNEDKSLAVMLNGEIYNYVELRGLLKAKGHRFSTTSDTEVLVHLYEEYGEASFAMLNGFFAFALYDAAKDIVRIVRDRWGIKPLYYNEEGGRLAYASEIKAFRALGRGFDLDRDALWDYFSYGYLPAEGTMLAGVRLLPPGCFIKAAPGAPAAVKRYHVLERDPQYGKLNQADAEKIYFGKVENAVKIALRSDVPVGLFLSGGLDSNIILHEARSHMPGKISTYTVGFGNSGFDESSLVRRLAAEQGLNASFLTVTPAWVADNFSRLAGFHDSLSITPAFLALAKLSEAAAKDLKVVLSGAGGDELLMGYPTYQADLLWPWFHRLPAAARSALLGAARALPHGKGRLPAGYKFLKFAEGISYPFEKAHYAWRTIFSEEEKRALFNRDLFGGSARDSAWAYEQAFADAPAGWKPLERASFADLRVWMANMGMIQSDTFTMSSSLEMRPPLLENDLAAFLFSLPQGLKTDGFTTKKFFRRAYKGRLPDYITGQAKMGFHLPMADWLRGELKAFAAERLFSDSNADRYFNRAELEKLFAGHQSGAIDGSFKIFSIICFLEWVKQSRGLVKV